METRPVDPDFSSTELLYRRLAAADVDERGRVVADSLQFPAPSFDRGKYLDDVCQVLEHRADPSENGYASVAVGDLPRSFARGGSLSPLVIDPVDVPLPTNPAHCEVRVGRKGEPFSKNYSPSGVLKRAVKQEIAKKLTVLLPPTPPPPTPLAPMPSSLPTPQQTTRSPGGWFHRLGRKLGELWQRITRRAGK